MKKLLLVEVPDGYEFTHKTMEIHNPTIPHLGNTQYPEFTEIPIPTEEEFYKTFSAANVSHRMVFIWMLKRLGL